MRDLVIGMTLVRADGVVAHAGGKVVKNVAGYDLGKVLTGSYGTLGVITEVAFRLHPVAEAQCWVSVPVGSDHDLQETLLTIVHSQVVPSAVELDRPAGAATLSLLLEGSEPGTKARTEQTLRLLGDKATARDQPPPWWGREPASGTGVLVKVTHEIARLTGLLAALDEAEAATGLTIGMRGSPAIGTALVTLDGDATAERLAQFLEVLRQRSSTFGGTAVLLEAPASLRDGVDVWGPVGALDLMWSVKHQFDPERRLAPGRFVGGI